MPAISRTVRIGSAHGLHARPAKMFAQAAKDAGIPVTMAKDAGNPVNAASILGVIALGVEQGDYVTLTADGDGADGVLDTLAELLSTDHDAEIDMSELRGVGIGLGVAQGPVARMAEPLPAPSDAPSALSADDEKARVSEAVAAVARELEERGAQAGGAARDVLEAQAMMAEDPTLADEVATRLAAGAHRRVGRLRRVRVVPRPAHGAGRLPRRARRRPRRRRPAGDRAAARRSGSGRARSRASVRARREGPRARRHRPARPRQGARARHHRGRPDLAHGDPRPREVDRRGRRRRGRERARRRRDGDRGCRGRRGHDRPDRRGARAGAAIAPRPGHLRHPPRSPTARSPTALPCRCWRTSANPRARPRPSRSAPKGSGCSARSSSSSARRARRPSSSSASRTRSCCRRSPARRSSCACSTPAPTSRWPFLNDAHEENPALGLRGIRALRASEDILREQLTALAEAHRSHAADRRRAGGPLGHGADGRDRRRDRVLHRYGPRLRHQAPPG